MNPLANSLGIHASSCFISLSDNRIDKEPGRGIQATPAEFACTASESEELSHAHCKNTVRSSPVCRPLSLSSLQCFLVVESDSFWPARGWHWQRADERDRNR